MTIPVEIKTIGTNALPENVAVVYYQGELADWLSVSVSRQSLSAEVYFNGELQDRIEIPDSTERLTSSFGFFKNIRSVTVPKSITELGENAFPGCSEGLFYEGTVADWLQISFMQTGVLSGTSDVYFDGQLVEDITIPGSIKTIPQGAFWFFHSLRKVTLEEGIESIGDFAFSLSGLTCMNLPDSIQTLTAYSLYGITNATIYCEAASAPGGWDTKWASGVSKTFMNIPYSDYLLWKTMAIETETIIPEGISYVPAGMFSGNTKLTRIQIPDSVRSIAAGAFSGCTALTEVMLPVQLRTIEKGTFQGCTRLGTVTIPDTVTAIGESAFSGCQALRKIYIPESVTTIQASYSSGPFYSCSDDLILFVAQEQGSVPADWSSYWSRISYQEPKIAYGVSPEEYQVCDPYNTALTKADLSGLTSIAAYAFYNCTNLSQITGQASVSRIGAYAFYNNQKLNVKTCVFTDALEQIGTYAFSQCSGTELQLSGRVVIGEHAYEKISTLRKIALGSSVQKIGACAFANCSQLLQVTFSNETVEIGENAFQDSGKSNIQSGVIDFYAPTYASTAYTYYEAHHPPIEFHAAALCAEGEHVWKALPAEEPACTLPGKQEGRECEKCGLVEQELIPATGHIPGETVIENETAANCLAEGRYDEVIYCTACGEELSRTARTLEKLPHSLTIHIDAKAATCTEEGNTAYWQCEICGHYFADAAGRIPLAENAWILPADGHSWQDPRYTWAEDNRTVTAVRTCAREDAEETETVAAAEVYTAPSCEEDGGTTWTSESFVNPAFAVQEKKLTEPALGHEWGAWNPDEEGSGTETRVCRREDTHTQTRPLADHEDHTPYLQKVEEQAAGCDTDGNSAYWYCTACGRFFADAEGTQEMEENAWILLAGHVTQEVPAQEETCSTDGWDAYWRCTVCGKLFAEEAAVTELAEPPVRAKTDLHTPETVPGYPATESADGLTDGSRCAVCGIELKAQEVIPKRNTQETATSGTPQSGKTEKKTSTVKLKEKTVKYNGKKQEIGKAVVKGSGGKVTYMYYTDPACTKMTSKAKQRAAKAGAAPKNAGTYYVKATVAADATYRQASSKAVKLVIQKAASTVKFTKKTKTATYKNKAITGPKARKTGSTKKITYTYYKDAKCKVKTTKKNSGAKAKGKAPKYAGTYYVKATVAADANYKKATSKAAKLVIKEAASTIAFKDNLKTATYTGKTIAGPKVTKTGSAKKVKYTYYIDAKCKTRTTKENSGAATAGGEPKNAGIYYVRASVAAEKGKYKSAETKQKDTAKLVINPKVDFVWNYYNRYYFILAKLDSYAGIRSFKVNLYDAQNERIYSGDVAYTEESPMKIGVRPGAKATDVFQTNQKYKVVVTFTLQNGGELNVESRYMSR